MLPMIPIINRHMSESNIKFSIILPKSENLQALFIRSNWAHFIDPFNYSYVETASSTHCPAIRFSNADEQFRAVDKILSIILNSADVSPDSIRAIEWSLNEITDNVLNHAGDGVSGYVQCTWFREKNIVEFVVADSGIGIPASLREKDNCLALERAIQEGVTRDRQTNQGNGLYGSYRIAQVARGSFSLVSHMAVLNHLPDGEVRIRPSKTPYAGTCVLWNMNTTQSEILSEALIFSGQSHEPSFDFVERLSGDSGLLHIGLKAAFPSLGSRTAGDKVHIYLRNLLKSDRILGVDVDFAGVNIISSSFAEEVFGRLFVELGPIGFMTRVKLTNAGPQILGLIDRAIIQRSASTTPIR